MLNISVKTYDLNTITNKYFDQITKYIFGFGKITKFGKLYENHKHHKPNQCAVGIFNQSFCVLVSVYCLPNAFYDY